MLHFKISFPQLSEILKETYVEVAEEKFTLADKPQTHSRISVLTGINRKDVRRLREKSSKDQDTPKRIDVSARMISRWMGEAPYLDKEGHPLTLPLKSEYGPSFRQLVIDICKKDFASGVIIDEWLDLGIITLENEKVTLNKEDFIGKKDVDEKVFFLGHNVSDHVSAISFNLLNEGNLFFDRCIYYDGLCEDSLKEIEMLISKKGMETLVAANKVAVKLRKRDAKRTNNHHRINVGLFVYHEDESPRKDY